MITPDAFDAYYYRHCCGQEYVRNEIWLNFFGGIADRIVKDIQPKRVLDAGCAMGFLVETLRDRGVDAWGVDLSPYAIEKVYEPVRPYCRVGSITEDLGGDYDLIVSIEVAEHMTTREGETAIANICAHTTDVLFSSSPQDFREPTHVNVHQPEYWAEQFARHDFYRDVDYDATYILPWAARFRKRTDPTHRLVLDYERRYWELLRAATDARDYSTEIQQKLAAIETERDALRATADVLTTERDGLKAALDGLRDERDGLRSESERLQGLLRENTQQLHDATALRDIAVARLRETERLLGDARQQVEGLIRERQDLHTALADTADRLRRAEDTIFHMKRSLFWKARTLLRRG